jgi:hypothetical protein
MHPTVVRTIIFCGLICFTLSANAQLQPYENQLVYTELENGNVLWTDYYNWTKTVYRETTLISESKFNRSFDLNDQLSHRFRISQDTYREYRTGGKLKEVTHYRNGVKTSTFYGK